MPNNKRRGKIIKIPDQTPGVIFSEGEQLFFEILSVWMSQETPRTGMDVEFSVGDHGNIVSACPVDAQIIAKEKMQAIKEKVIGHGGTSKNMALNILTDLNNKMGTMTLSASVIYALSFLFIPFFSIGMQSFTPWNALGAIRILSSADTSSGHGFIGLVGIMVLFTPFVSPFIKQWWAMLLNFIPALYVVIFGLYLWLEVHDLISSAESATSSMLGSSVSGMMNGVADRIWNAISLDYGAYLWAISAIIIGVPTLMKLFVRSRR